MKGLVYNHEIYEESFGHGLEPKIFWSAESGKGPMGSRLLSFAEAKAFSPATLVRSIGDEDPR